MVDHKSVHLKFEKDNHFYFHLSYFSLLRSDPHMMVSLEKAITKGSPVLLRNCGDHIDNMIAPLVHHRNTAHECDREEGEKIT